MITILEYINTYFGDYYSNSILSIPTTELTEPTKLNEIRLQYTFSIPQYTILIILSLLLITLWYTSAKQDAKHLQIDWTKCFAIATCSILYGITLGARYELLIGVILFLVSLFGPDNFKYIGMADLMIPAHFLCCYMSPKIGFWSIITNLILYLISILIFIKFHKFFRGTPWVKGQVSSGLPPYAIMVTIATFIDPFITILSRGIIIVT